MQERLLLLTNTDYLTSKLLLLTILVCYYKIGIRAVSWPQTLTGFIVSLNAMLGKAELFIKCEKMNFQQAIQN